VDSKRLLVGRSAALACTPTVARPCEAEPKGVRPYISAGGGTHKNERAKPECLVQSVTSISALVPTIPKKQVDSRRRAAERQAFCLHMLCVLPTVHRALGSPGRPCDRKILCLTSSRRGTTIHAVAPYPVYRLLSTGFQPPKPESDVESATSILALPPTIPKKAVDTRPYTVDRSKEGPMESREGSASKKRSPKMGEQSHHET